MKPKLLIVLLLLLLFLMVAAVSIGSSGQSTRWFSGGLDVQTGSWATNVRDWLTADLPADAIVDMRPRTCRPRATRVVLTPSDNCYATITATNDSTRQLHLELLQGEAVTVILEQENALTVELTLTHNTADNSATLDIYKDEALRNATLRINDCRLPEQTDEEEEEDGGKESAEPIVNCVLAIAS